MEMEFIAEVTENISRDRAQQIIKRKRTKRQRPCSPFTTSGDCLIHNSANSASEISSEEEDMANCLIMLAQSNSPVMERNSGAPIRRKTIKLTSRRFTDNAGVTAGGIRDSCDYECKTCNRTFPSFQALGGHRASHKKINVEEKKTSSVNIPSTLTEYSDGGHDQRYRTVVEENKANMIISNNVLITGIIKGKIHECSICGSEFSSGQALGGHMRKHRPILTSVNGNSNGNGNGSSMLSLDLNFPPPEFQFTVSSSQQQHLVFSAPALVDCHY